MTKQRKLGVFIGNIKQTAHPYSTTLNSSLKLYFKLNSTFIVECLRKYLLRWQSFPKPHDIELFPFYTGKVCLITNVFTTTEVSAYERLNETHLGKKWHNFHRIPTHCLEFVIACFMCYLRFDFFAKKYSNMLSFKKAELCLCQYQCLNE